VSLKIGQDGESAQIRAGWRREAREMLGHSSTEHRRGVIVRSCKAHDTGEPATHHSLAAVCSRGAFRFR